MIDAVEHKEKKGSCNACGNSPANHTLSYISSSLSLALAPVLYPLLRNTCMQWVSPVFFYTAPYVTAVYYWYSYVLGIVRYNATDKSTCGTYRSQVVWEEAEKRGIRMEQVTLYRKPIEAYRAHLPHGTIYFDSIPIPPRLATVNQQWIDDKWYLKKVLREAGIPVPTCTSVTSPGAALEVFKRMTHTRNTPVIIKPRLGTRGRHVTTHITTEKDLRVGFVSAQQLCHYVCIEQHLTGSVCRGTLVDKKLCGFFEARPISVVGDGTSTVRSLVAAKNAQRHERVHEIVLTEEHAAYLAQQTYTYDSVLPHGTEAYLTHRTGRLFGGETYELLDTVHPTLRTYLERAAAVIDVPIVGFDLIISDPRVDPDIQEWGILEANAVPFIDLHALPLYGTPSYVAKQVWDLWQT